MVSFDKFIMTDGPIYQQIITFIKREISSGNINGDDEMPSRRVLSSLLGVNPNTVQKAYSILEDEGIIQSHSGAKSVIVLNEAKRKNIRTELLETDVADAVKAFKQMGISKEEAFELIRKIWKDGE